MPSPLVGILGGSSLLGFLGSKSAADAAASGADASAQAHMYATDRQIEAAEKAREEAVAASKLGNKLATAAESKGVRGEARQLLKGSRQSKNALLEANEASAGKLVGNAAMGRDALVGGAAKGMDALVGAERKNKLFFDKVLNKQTGALADWRQAGRAAIQKIEKGIGSGKFSMDSWEFKADPGYKFRLQQGEKALGRTAAAQGNMLSGNALAAAAKFGQGLASEEYAAAYGRGRQERVDQFGRLMDVSEVGRQAVNDTNVLTGVHAGRIGDANRTIGGAQADFFDAKGRARADFFNTKGLVRAGEADVRGNVLSDAAKYGAGVRGGVHSRLGALEARRQLNVANTAAGAALNAGNVAANAYQAQGTGVANAYQAAADAKAQGILGGVQAVQGGLQNWLTYDLLKGGGGLLGGAG